MASCSQMHARIRLNFVNSPLDSVWMLVDYKKLPLISDIVYEINKRYFGGSTELTLSLHGSRLPLEEGSLLLRDEDAVTVRVERQDNDSGSTTTAVNTTAVEVKKTGKRKHEDTDSEEILTKEQSSVHSSSREEDKHARKKRKKEQKKREKERLKEIADIVSSYTDVSHSYSSKHESSKDASASSKKTNNEDSHSRDKIKDDSTRVYAGTSKQEKDSASNRHDREKKNEKHQQGSDKDSHHGHGEKHKRNRIRKHRKHKSKKSAPEPSADPVQLFLSNAYTSQTAENQASESMAVNHTGWDRNVKKYTGNPVNQGQAFYGALPDKLLQPKYYRHQYHNLRKYTAEPNTHTKFHSDSENEEKEENHNLEQYNFLCSTRYSEFQEAEAQQPNTPQMPDNLFTSPDVLHNNFNANFNDSTPDFQSSSTPNTSENTREKTDDKSVKNNSALDLDKVNNDLSNETEQESVSRNDRFSAGNLNNSNTNPHNSFNGYNGYAEGRDNTGTVATPAALVQSVLPNGVTVFSRQRRRTPKAEMFTKEQQLNDVATNRSFIVQNPSEPEVSQIDGFKIDPGETLKAEKFKKNNSTFPPPARKDYSTFPALAGPPRIGDKIAYKVLEMSPEYTPEVSDYKEAEVLNYDQATQNVHLKSLFKTGTNKNPFGNKFDISLEYGDTLLTNVEEESDETMFHWTSLLEPRLVS